MNVAQSLLATLVLAAASLTPAAHATVIDFNHLAGANIAGASANNSVLSQFNFNASFTTNGFQFTGTTGYGYLLGTAYSNSDSNVFAYNGTDYYMNSAGIIIASAAASPFKVDSIDLVQWRDDRAVSQATLTGTKVNGATVTRIINLSTISNQSKQTGNDFTTYSLSGFDNLSSLTITHNSGYHLGLDNLVVNSTNVPEPSSMALLGLAMAGCAFMRRRAGNKA